MVYANKSYKTATYEKSIEDAYKKSALILNWFYTNPRLSSGIVKGFNNKAKRTIKKTYGFMDIHTYAKVKNTYHMPYIISLESYHYQNLPIDLTV